MKKIFLAIALLIYSFGGAQTNTSAPETTTVDSILVFTSNKKTNHVKYTTLLNKVASDLQVSGINTGDNAVNNLYSGLATSKQNVLTLTTTGTSGAATLVGATLNIPQYAGGGGTWGSITGTLTDQTDLQSALDLKANTTDLVNTAFLSVPATTFASPYTYNATRPNIEIDLTGNINLDWADTVNGDFGMVWLHDYSGQTITYGSATAPTNTNYPTGLVKLYFVHSLDGLSWSLENPTTVNGSETITVQTVTGDGNTTINWGTSVWHKFTFGAQNEVISFTNPSTPKPFLTLELIQDATGGRTVTWGNTIYAVGGVLPTLSTGVNDIDVLHFSFENGKYKLLEEYLDYQAVAGVDIQAPTAPTSLVASGATETTINLSWSAASDNVAVTGYDVYKGGVLEASLGNVLSYTVTGLISGTSYSFTVRAKDAIGNISDASNTATLSTSAGADLSAFIMAMRTTVDGGTVDFTTSWDSGQSFTVDWGDGTTQSYTGGSQTVSHVYGTAGTYDVSITGTAWKGILGRGTITGDLIEIKQWGTGSLSSFVFSGCTALTSISATDVPVFNTAKNSSLSAAFIDCTALTSINNIGNWNLSGIVNINEMFRNCTALAVNGLSGIGNWNTSTITTASGVFRYAGNFNYNLGSWDIGTITNFTNFAGNTTTWSSANWDATLIGWASQSPDIVNSLTFNRGSAVRTTAADAAYTTLTTTHLWTISN